MALCCDHPPAGVALVPGAVEVLGHGPELHDKVAREVLRLSLAALLAPELDQGRLVIAHDDPGVRTANKGAAVSVGFCVGIHISSTVYKGSRGILQGQ